MLNFFNRKISTLAGIIIILLVAVALGVAIVRQFRQLIEVRTGIVERVISDN